MKKALVYVRLISDMQGYVRQTQDYKSQKQDIELYCKANDYKIDVIFEDKFIADNKDKNFIVPLMQYFKDHKDTKYLIIQEISRLGNGSEIISSINALNDIGICTIITNINLATLKEDSSINELAMQAVLNLSQSKAQHF